MVMKTISVTQGTCGDEDYSVTQGICGDED